MSRGRERRSDKVSAARRRAEQHSTGFETTTLRVPEGVGFYDLKVGVHEIDIVPFKAGKGNPYAEPGELYYERTFYIYRGIGIEEKNYVCPSKTFGKPDYIQEYKQSLSKNPDADPDEIKSLAPKERQIFFVYNSSQADKGLQLLETSFHTFGNLLDSRIKNSREVDGWDLFYYPDEDGMTLRLTVEEVSGGGYKYKKVTAIDFMRREEPLPEAIVNHGFCLDDCLVEYPYEKLKKIFLAIAEDEDEEGKEKNEDQQDSRSVSQSGSGSGRRTTEPSKNQRDPEDDKPKGNAEKEDAKAREQDKETAKAKSASDFVRDQEVIYKGRLHTVLRAKNDLLILMDEDDELIKDVDPNDVEIVTKEDSKSKEESPKANKKADKEEEPFDGDDGDDDDDEWDKDWT